MTDQELFPGNNVKRHSDTFEEEVQMWVYQEQVRLDAIEAYCDRISPI